MSEFASALSLKSNEKSSIVTTLDDTETGEFWIDLKPGGGHDGGKFENENSKWSISTVVTEDDFDDTDRLIPEWASSDGIYSSIRSDQDLNDGTDADGAWCVAAGECGGLVTKEYSTGYTYIRSKADYMYLPDYVNTNLPSFEITSATLYCDYKIWAKDYDNEWNYVILNTYVKNNNGKYGFFKFQKTASNAPDTIGNGYPGGGKCTDYWDPGDNFKAWPDPKTDGKNDYTVSQMSDGASFAKWLNNHGLSSKLSLTFHLDIHLIGEIGYNEEYFKFRLDDVGIKCEYKYTNPENRYALTIGIADYPGTENDLESSATDANLMKNILSTKGGWNTQILVDQQATRSNVESKIVNWMVANEDNNDISLIYFTGHGSQLQDDDGDEPDGIDECLCLYDIDSPSGYWRDDDFATTLDLFEGRVIVILDSCFSGGMPMLIDSKGGNDDSYLDIWNNEFLTEISGSKRIILMACQEYQTTMGLINLDPDLNHVLFTLGILSALNGAGDSNNNAEVNIDECFNHAKSLFHSTQTVLFGGVTASARMDYSDGDLKNIRLVSTSNKPPAQPDTPSGPESAKKDDVCTYETTVSDPDKDKIKVFFFWDDYNVDTPSELFTVYSNVNSGSTVSPSHKWTEKGTYYIRALARDEHGAFSAWSGSLIVSITKKSRSSNFLIQRLLEHFTDFPLLIKLQNLKL